MLNKVLRIYLVFTIFFFFIFNLQIEDKKIWLLVNHLLNTLFFCFNLWYTSKKKNSLNKSFLSKNILLSSLFFIFINNILSYYYTGSFFIFSEADAILYHSIAEKFQVNGYDFFHAFSSSSSKDLLFDDWGMPFLLSILYLLYSSNLVLNLFYILLSLFSARHMYNLSKNFMSNKFAYFATITFFTSSFIFWFNSSGLKESFMVYLIIAIFDLYYRFLKKRDLKVLIAAVLLLIIMLFFRPVVSFLIIGGIGIGLISNMKIGFTKTLLISILVLGMVLSFPFILDQKQKFANTDYDAMIETKDAMIKGGVGFTYAVNVLGSFFGPFPSFDIEEKTILSFFSSGLLFKVFISFFSFMGIITILKNNNKVFYPITVFLLLEIGSLIYILESLELRKSLPHFPIFYIIGFWVLYQISENKFITTKKAFPVISIVLIGLVFYWNFR